ncbi:MAG: hypothetical protein PVF58_15985 [Candidatus Methanofastidiosia archaeon]
MLIRHSFHETQILYLLAAAVIVTYFLVGWIFALLLVIILVPVMMRFRQ